MSLSNAGYKSEGMVYEIQVGTFSIIGKFSVLVLEHVKKIFEVLERPLFVGAHPLRILLEDTDEIVKNDDLSSQVRILILDPFFRTHQKLAKEYRGQVSWFSISNPPRANYRGTYFKNGSRELLYVKENMVESYVLPASIQITRELAAAICAARETGIQQHELRRVLDFETKKDSLGKIVDFQQLRSNM